MFDLYDFLMYLAASVVIVIGLGVFITLLGLIVGESPTQWWKGFWY